jgi:hypothetical protein
MYQLRPILLRQGLQQYASEFNTHATLQPKPLLLLCFERFNHNTLIPVLIKRSSWGQKYKTQKYKQWLDIAGGYDIKFLWKENQLQWGWLAKEKWLLKAGDCIQSGRRVGRGLPARLYGVNA